MGEKWKAFALYVLVFLGVWAVGMVVCSLLNFVWWSVAVFAILGFSAGWWLASRLERGL